MAKDNKAIIHCCVEKEVYDKLMAHCNATGQTKTTAVKRAINEYCKDVVEKDSKKK